MTDNGATEDLADLELSPAAMQAMGNEVLQRVTAYTAALPDVPSIGDYTSIEALCRAMRENAPEHGTPLDALLDPLVHEWIPRSFN
ncbi:MAG: hypothetical protein ACRES9_03405, partial [Gammaproteobacteria bacterium]